jgi:hypothetical protein
LASALGRSDTADAHFARAEAIEARIDAPLLAAMTRRRRSGGLRLDAA